MYCSSQDKCSKEFPLHGEHSAWHPPSVSFIVTVEYDEQAESGSCVESGSSFNKWLLYFSNHTQAQSSQRISIVSQDNGTSWDHGVVWIDM
jgi:hypothetical protein